MDILSFILGMAVVVVITVAVVAVIAFVKVRKHDKQIEDIHSIFSGEYERVYNNIADLEKHIVSLMDSRLDKLENKIQITSRKA